MLKLPKLASLLLTLALLLTLLPARAVEGLDGRLVSVAWLEKNLARGDLLILDASPGPLHKQQHIPGAVNADLFTYGPVSVSAGDMERRLRAWGVNAGQQIVIHDQGGSYFATKLFWDLVHYGLPVELLFILDGGMAKWRSVGGAVTQQATAAPTPGTVRITTLNQEVRVRLPEFLAATGDPRDNVMLEALEPAYYYGGAGYFNRAGHVPHATLMPSTDFFNPDQTFKSPQEMRRMLDHLGIRPDQQIHTYCGGGGAAAVPFFALKYLLGYPRVRLYQESQMGWLQDERELPFWTYSAPYLARDSAWLKAWGSPMLKAFGLSRVSIVDVRSPEEFRLGHVPLAVNLPVQAFQSAPQRLDELAALLAKAGVDPLHEVVVVSEGGLNEHSALAYLMLETLGLQKVSVLTDSTERWAELGHAVVRPAVAAGAGRTAEAPSAQAAPWTAKARGDRLVVDPQRTEGQYPKVYVASGRQLPSRTPPGKVVHLPYDRLLNPDGTPRPAKDIWKTLAETGVPRYAEVVLFADTLGEAAVNYLVFRMMGLPDLKVWAP